MRAGRPLSTDILHGDKPVRIKPSVAPTSDPAIVTVPSWTLLISLQLSGNIASTDNLQTARPAGSQTISIAPNSPATSLNPACNEVRQEPRGPSVPRTSQKPPDSRGGQTLIQSGHEEALALA